MAKRYLARSRASEDVTGLAGWLFTDLLLGLVMVFISAVAFVAYKNADDGSTALRKCTERAAAFVKEPLQIRYKKGEGSEIGKDISEYLVTKKNTLEAFENPRVAVGIIYGWYQEGGNANDGVKAAKTFYDRFHESDPDNFPALDKNGIVPNMRFIGTQGQYAAPEGTGVDLFFVYDTCSKFENMPATTTP